MKIGRDVARIAQRLLDEGARDRQTVRPSSTRRKSPPMELRQPAREIKTDSTCAPDLRSGGYNGAADEAWSLMNRRRAELIFKKNRGRITDAECSELERLQALSRSRMEREFPGPTLIDEKLKRVEESLCGDGAEKV
jgi:hypothetical protein